MLSENKHWASGNWQVSDGKTEEFIERWRAFLTWTRDENKGFLGARLIRDLANPSHFVSFASWEDLATLRAWQGRPEFAESVAACRALCDDVRSGVYELAVDV
ncbi:antibiotic biosynthesis monooxygenase family protein [Streptacidiphilus sp. MAP5-3]|uniref:antibiotic biosynthesis monooxygenase family protein n=1 Tax=unclassified Streptacidiphilus TaxID=2643834 RepID=UPI0035145B84